MLQGLCFACYFILFATDINITHSKQYIPSYFRRVGRKALRFVVCGAYTDVANLAIIPLCRVELWTQDLNSGPPYHYDHIYMIQYMAYYVVTQWGCIQNLFKVCNSIYRDKLMMMPWDGRTLFLLFLPFVVLLLLFLHSHTTGVHKLDLFCTNTLLKCL